MFFMVTGAESPVTEFGSANASLLFQAHPESKSYDPQTGLFRLPGKNINPQSELRKNFFLWRARLQKQLKEKKAELADISTEIKLLQTTEKENPTAVADQLYLLMEKQFSTRCSFLQNFLHLYSKSQADTEQILSDSHLSHEKSTQKIRKIWQDINIASHKKMIELKLPAVFNSAVTGHREEKPHDTHLLFVKNLPEDHFFAALCTHEKKLQPEELKQTLNLFLQKEDFITSVISTGTIDITTEISSLIQMGELKPEPEKTNFKARKVMLHPIFLLHPEMLKFDWNYRRFVSGNRYFFFQPHIFKNVRQLMRGISFNPETYQILERLTILELNNTEKEAVNTLKIPQIQQQIQATVSEWQQKKELSLLFQENALLPGLIEQDLQKRLILAPCPINDNSIELLANFYRGQTEQQKDISEKLLAAFEQLLKDRR
jgi:hypothetical protein